MRIEKIFKLLLVLSVLIGLSYGVTASKDVSSKSTTLRALNSNDLVSKRDIKAEDSQAKSYEPAPEYYRGPSASVSSPPLRFDSRDKDRISSSVIGLKPFITATGHENPYIAKHLLGASGDKGGGYDRDRVIGNGHHYNGASGYGNSGYGNDYYGHATGSGGVGLNDRTPYGQPIAIDFPASKYGSSGLGGLLHGKLHGYGNPSGPGGYHQPSALDWSHRGYGGGEYGSSYPPTDNHYPGKAELAKGILLPLAGAAFLGLAAALIANPLLLQLGTVSGKKRKRAVNADEENVYESKIFNADYNAQDMAYKEHFTKL